SKTSPGGRRESAGGHGRETSDRRLSRLRVMPVDNFASHHVVGRVRLQSASGTQHPVHQYPARTPGHVVFETLWSPGVVLEQHPQGPRLRTALHLADTTSNTTPRQRTARRKAN